MRSVAGIFTSRADAERAVRELSALGVTGDRVSILAPGNGAGQIERVPTSDTEQPGIGAVVGSVVGAATGLSGGAMATVLMPGVGPVIGVGLAAMALLGLTGAVTGAAVGGALESSLANGLPKDELFLYEDALRQGRTVVIALVDDATIAARVRETLCRAGAEEVDAARERWWIGLRDAEREHYRETGSEFANDEPYYRRGFEAALRPESRGKSWEDARAALGTGDPADANMPAFRRGYERGRAYQQRLVETERR